MGEIVGAEGKEFRFPGDLARDQRGARQFDHGADKIFDGMSFFFEDFFRHPVNDRCLVRHFIQCGCKRDHHFGMDLDAVFGDGNCRFEDGARLHLGNLGIGNSEPATAMSEHGIDLVELLDAL